MLVDGIFHQGVSDRRTAYRVDMCIEASMEEERDGDGYERKIDVCLNDNRVKLSILCFGP